MNPIVMITVALCSFFWMFLGRPAMACAGYAQRRIAQPRIAQPQIAQPPIAHDIQPQITDTSQYAKAGSE